MFEYNFYNWQQAGSRRPDHQPITDPSMNNEFNTAARQKLQLNAPAQVSTNSSGLTVNSFTLSEI